VYLDNARMPAACSPTLPSTAVQRSTPARSAAVRSFLPNDIEAVWELAEHRYVYIKQQPESGGHAQHTIFVDDLDSRVAAISERGIEPVDQATYSNGVRKITYRDPYGNEIGFGGAPL
jgi:hypothetical protein